MEYGVSTNYGGPCGWYVVVSIVNEEGEIV